MKKNTKPASKLSLTTSTVRDLVAKDIELAAGGFSSDTIYNTCRYGGGCRNSIPYACDSGGFSC